MSEKKERYLVTSALPYANGPLHVGHAIGAYVPADVYVRYRKLRGDDVIFICGTDEYGTPISVRAEEEGVEPQEVVNKYHKMHDKAFKGLGVEFDNFSGTARPIHNKTAQDIFLKVKENGFLKEETVERPYCPSCDRFLPDRYVKGTCPFCGAEDQRGDQCEVCGKQYESVELKNPGCSICGGTPEVRETAHWFFKLSEFQDRLKSWLKEEDKKHPISDSFPDNARNFSLGWIKEGLTDRAITRDMKWGIPVPLPDTKGKVLYVWFDAPIGYVSSTKEWGERIGKKDLWKDYWMGEGTRIVHFIGKDNIPFHAIIWPAVLLAHGDFNIPWNVASNEYLNLEGQKMSTSRGWVVWLHELLAEFEPDSIRYYLISNAPETSDSDFVFSDFQEKVNSELIATLGNFINRTLTFIQNKKGGVVSEKKNMGDVDKSFLEFLKKSPDHVGKELERFSFKLGQSRLLEVSQKGNIYFQNKEPWKEESETTLYLCANLCRSLAILMHPFLPFSAEKIWKIMKLPGKVSEQSWESAGELGVKAGHKIGKVETLYKKIEEEDITSFKKKYLKVEEEKKKEVEVKELVDITDFQRMDLRVGTIKEAKQHPQADKLMLLDVDCGEFGQRQLVAGVTEQYGLKELVGRQIIVLVNLKPAKIRGEESQGMLLAADVDGKPILIAPDKEVKAGTKIR
ncbi:methionine--tRNA ligase [Candidatus Altiarchaeota archaeon]